MSQKDSLSFVQTAITGGYGSVMVGDSVLEEGASMQWVYGNNDLTSIRFLDDAYPNNLTYDYDTIRVASKVIFEYPVEGIETHNCNSDAAWGFAFGMALWVLYFIIKKNG